MNWTGAGDGATWFMDANWDIGVPQAGENVCITAASVTYDNTATAPANIALGAAATLAIADGVSLNHTGNLTLAANATVTAYGTLNTEGGVVLGTGSQLIIDDGLFTPGTASAITGTGTLTFRNGTGNDLGGTGALTIDGPSVVLAAAILDISNRAITIASGSFTMGPIAVITDQTAASITVASGATFIKTGPGAAAMQTQLYNDGEVDVARRHADARAEQ